MQAVFGPIEIAGNIGVADPSSGGSWPTCRGKLFQAGAIEESQRRLLRLGLFNSVDITIVNPATPMFEVPTRVTVAEGDHTQVTYFFGYGSEEGPYGDLGWRHLNVGGRARTVSTRGRWSSLDRGVEGAFTEISRHLHTDAGIGVRYRSPFGLFRFDVGQQLTTVPGLAGERRWRMHFGIGQAF